MDGKQRSDVLIRSILFIAALVIIIAGLREARAIVLPVVVSIFVAMTLFPAVLWLQKNRIPSAVSVFIVVFGLLIFGAGISFMAGKSVEMFAERLPVYEERLRAETLRVLEYTKKLGVEIPETGVLSMIEPGTAFSIAAKLVGEFGKFLANAFLVLLIATFILLEVADVPGRIARAFGNGGSDFGWFVDFTRNLHRYLMIKTIISLATGACVTGWLWFLGVDFPILWGLLAFMLNYVPNIGSFIAAIPAVLLTIVQLGWGNALLVILGYLVINIVWGMILEPRFLGYGLGISTLIVFLSMLFWGYVLGTIGVLLSVPLTMTVIIALKSKPETKWIPIILGSGGK
ncbi:MAG TPA: AI-2E family transporter [Acidobacteriota bacterium]|nr:AI-2E family transporter [Acidobacteriota bacterium]